MRRGRVRHRDWGDNLGEAVAIEGENENKGVLSGLAFWRDTPDDNTYVVALRAEGRDVTHVTVNDESGTATDVMLLEQAIELGEQQQADEGEDGVEHALAGGRGLAAPASRKTVASVTSDPTIRKRKSTKSPSTASSTPPSTSRTTRACCCSILMAWSSGRTELSKVLLSAIWTSCAVDH